MNTPRRTAQVRLTGRGKVLAVVLWFTAAWGIASILPVMWWK